MKYYRSFFRCFVFLILLTISFTLNAQDNKGFNWLAPMEFQKCRYFDCHNALVCQTAKEAEVYFLETGKRKKIPSFIIQNCIPNSEYSIIYKGQNQGLINSAFEEIVSAEYSTLRVAKESGYFMASKSELDSSFLINTNVQPVEILGFSGNLINKGKGFVKVSSYNNNTTKIYDLNGKKLFENEEYRLSPIDENSNYIIGEHKENDQQVIFNIDGSILYHAPKNCFGTFKDLGNVFSVDCFDGDFFVDKTGKTIKDEIKIADEKYPIQIINNCGKGNKLKGIYFNKTNVQSKCKFASFSTLEQDVFITAFDENYRMTLFDLEGKVVYKGGKSQVVFPLGHNMFRVVENTKYPVTGGKTFGVKNGKGKTIVPFKYSAESDFSRPCKTYKVNEKVFLLISQGNENHIFNEKGKQKTKKVFSSLSKDFNTYYKLVNDLLLIKANGKVSLMDFSGNIILEADEIQIMDSASPYGVLGQEEKYSLYDLKTSQPILEGYEQIDLRKNQVAILKKDGLVGAIQLK